MKLSSHLGLLGLTLTSAFVLVACGGSGGGTAQTIATNGDQLAFNTTTLTAPANQAVTVTFQNKSAGQTHNWVLVKGGDTEAQAVDDAAASAPNNIPDDPNIAGHTDTIAGGATGTATFTLPAGTYVYMCTVPGHYGAGMKGTLTIQ